MRLSDAIALGRTLVKPKGGIFITPGGTEGCAIGMAMTAVGEHMRIGKQGCVDDYLNRVCEIWPWLDGFEMARITTRFDCLVDQQRIDEFIDWVRSIEPAEKEIAVEEVQESEYASVT